MKPEVWKSAPVFCWISSIFSAAAMRRTMFGLKAAPVTRKKIQTEKISAIAIEVAAISRKSAVSAAWKMKMSICWMNECVYGFVIKGNAPAPKSGEASLAAWIPPRPRRRNKKVPGVKEITQQNNQVNDWWLIYAWQSFANCRLSNETYQWILLLQPEPDWNITRTGPRRGEADRNITDQHHSSSIV